MHSQQLLLQSALIRNLNAMSRILSIQDIVHQRKIECVGVLSRKFMNSVRPIYGSTEGGAPDHIGSCVLVDFNGRKHLVTAAHVLDHLDETHLYVGGEIDLVPFNQKARVTNALSGNRHDDRIDIAVITIDDKCISKMGQVVFLDEDDILFESCSSDEVVYMALGYPNSRNKRLYKKKGKVSQNPFVYSSTLITKKDTFKEVKAFPEIHYLLQFDKKKSKDPSNNTITAISPKGASGGGLFTVDGLGRMETYINPSNNCHGKLVGVLIEYHPQTNVIIATKMAIVKDIMNTVVDIT